MRVSILTFTSRHGCHTAATRTSHAQLGRHKKSSQDALTLHYFPYYPCRANAASLSCCSLPFFFKASLPCFCGQGGGGCAGVTATVSARPLKH